jgi:hypothetical protein
MCVFRIRVVPKSVSLFLSCKVKIWFHVSLVYQFILGKSHWKNITQACILFTTCKSSVYAGCGLPETGTTPTPRPFYLISHCNTIIFHWSYKTEIIFHIHVSKFQKSLIFVGLHYGSCIASHIMHMKYVTTWTPLQCWSVCVENNCKN